MLRICNRFIYKGGLLPVAFQISGLYACAQDNDAIQAAEQVNTLELELGLRDLAMLMSSHAGEMV
jgi:hypothetical protein